MCGIAGIVDFAGRPVTGDRLREMTGTLRHRGPDGEGIWTAHTNGVRVGFGHRRLAILDLRDQAAQPMHNAQCAKAGRAAPLTLVFNGEIYNFRDLRSELVTRGHRFVSETDSEVLIHLYEEHGPDMVSRLRGMFAFAIWDEQNARLFCARDRLGKKPFYYRSDSGRLWFASEPKAILADPAVPALPAAAAIRAFLDLGYVPAELSAFQGLQRLRPGHWLVADRSGVREERYWRLDYLPKTKVSDADAAHELGERLRDSVRSRLVSDVPLGAFLSGGTDSSAVVALMSEASARVKTFSIGFDNQDFNELRYARTVANRYSTDHHELVVRPDAVEIAPKLAWHYGEPYADSSAVPTYYLAEFARRHITVALTGDGGDESFGGYRRYQAHVATNWYRHFPRRARGLIEHALARLPAAASSRSRVYDVHRFIGAASLPDQVRYASWFGFFTLHDSALQPSFVERTPSAGIQMLGAALASGRGLHPADAAMSADVSLYLPDDLLVKVDIATMANGLEARSPLLDHTLMEFVARLPVSMKIRGWKKKYLLREVCRDLVPAEIMSRPKMGFGVPLDAWFRGELQDYLCDIVLSPSSFTREYVRPDAVRGMLEEHACGRAAHGHRLWALLMLELWHRMCLNPRADAPAVSLSSVR
jgi:asparagine synthase (glutamine-hydrolysing)